MNAGGLTDFLQTHDRADEVEVEVHFEEAGESYASTSDASTFSHA